MQLHPNYDMVSELNWRIDALTTQRTHLLGSAQAALPPTIVKEDIVALPALPPSKPSPQLTYHAPQLFAQDLDALRRTLDRDRDIKYRNLEMESREKLNDELANADLDFEKEAFSLRQQLHQQYATAIISAQMSLDAAKRWADSQPSDASKSQLTKAEEKYQTTTTAYENALAKVDSDILAEKQLLREKKVHAMTVKLAEEDQRLRAEAEKILHARETQPVTETPLVPVGSIIPPMTFAARPAGTLTMPLEKFTAGVQASAARLTRQTTPQVQAIDTTIASLRAQRDRLRRNMLAETRDAARAVAAVHDCTLHFNTAVGTDLTPAVRDWLNAYW